MPFEAQWDICSWSPGLLTGNLTSLSHHAPRKHKLQWEACVDTLADSTSWAQPVSHLSLSGSKMSKETSRWFQHLAVWDRLAICVVSAKTPNTAEQRHTINAVYLLDPQNLGHNKMVAFLYRLVLGWLVFITINNQNKELFKKTPKQNNKLMLHPQIHIQLAYSALSVSVFLQVSQIILMCSQD